jgi:hypothetical protein
MTGPGALPLEAPRGQRSYEVQGRSVASVDTVWPLIGQAHRWKDWSFLDRTDLITVGEPLPDGVGAVRRFTSHGIGSREEVVVWDPPHHLGYVILSGFPVRHYRADVVLSPDGPDGTGTLVRWSGTFDELVPGTGRLLEVVLPKLMTRFITGLTGYADHRAPG